MDPTRFVAPRWGRAVSPGGPAAYVAFVPAALPRAMTLDADTVMLLSEADAALGRLAGAGRLLPDPHLLVNAYTTREAVASSRIEGTQASVTEVFDADVTGDTGRDDIREIRNYIAALRHGIDRMEDGFPISLRLIKENARDPSQRCTRSGTYTRRVPTQPKLDILAGQPSGHGAVRSADRRQYAAGT
jgi:hypothetical protein